MTPVSLHEQNPLRGFILMLVAILLFTIMSALIKVAREVVPPGEAVFYRAFFAIPPILIWAAWRGRIAFALRVRDRMVHVSRGIVGVGAMFLGFTALGLLPLPEVIAIGYATPLISTALAAVILRERVGPVRWMAVTVGFMGVLIMLWPRLTVPATGATDAQTLGAWAALAGAALGGLASVQIRKMTRTETTLSIVFWFAVISTLASLLTLPFGWTFPGGRIALLLVLGGLLGGIAQILLTESFRQADASALAPMNYTSMIYGLGIGYVFFAEVPGWSVLIGASIVISAGILIIWREQRLGIVSARARAVKPPRD